MHAPSPHTEHACTHPLPQARGKPRGGGSGRVSLADSMDTLPHCPCDSAMPQAAHTGEADISGAGTAQELGLAATGALCKAGLSDTPSLGGREQVPRWGKRGWGCRPRNCGEVETTETEPRTKAPCYLSCLLGSWPSRGEMTTAEEHLAVLRAQKWRCWVSQSTSPPSKPGLQEGTEWHQGWAWSWQPATKTPWCPGPGPPSYERESMGIARETPAVPGGSIQPESSQCCTVPVWTAEPGPGPARCLLRHPRLPMPAASVTRPRQSFTRCPRARTGGT